ncbi:MAG: thermonuclease family protein [Rhizobiaceae bacterium]
MRRPRKIRRRYRSRRSWTGKLTRWFVIPLVTAAVLVITAEALDFVLLNLLSRDVSRECTITGVVDGDTVRLSCRTLPVTRGRIRGIDAPELYSPSCVSEVVIAQQAKLALQAMLWAAGEVRIVIHGEDKFGRHLVSISADGNDIAGQMIADGHARRYGGGERQSWC